MQELRRAIDGRALFIPGNEETHRAGERLCVDEAQRRGDRRRNSALHVAGAPAEEHAVRHFRGERIVTPARNVSRRHDIRMAGEDQIGLIPSEARIEIEHVRRVGRREGDKLRHKARASQKVAEIRQRAFIVRRDRGKTDERAGDVESGKQWAWTSMGAGSE